MAVDQKRFNEYEALLKRLKFAMRPEDLTLEICHDVAATYVLAKEVDERIYIALRPNEGLLTRVALNPAAAFDLANAILEQGSRAGWYSIASVDGERVPKIRH